MLAANAHDGGFALNALWVPRRAAALAAEAAARNAARDALQGGAGSGAASNPTLAARARVVAVAIQTPVVLAQVVGSSVPDGQRFDGASVARGDAVLLTAQADPRENGVWTYAGGATPAVAAFPGMLVRVARGLLAAGWLFVCTAYSDATQSAAFLPVYSPVPTKAQVDLLRVDAATLGGQPLGAVGKDVVSAGGATSLVVSGAGAGSTAPYALRGLTAGQGVRLVAAAGEVVLHGGTAGTACALRPADVVAAGGQFRVDPEGRLDAAATDVGGGGGLPSEWTPLRAPVLRYAASAENAHGGDALFCLQGLPSGTFGLDLEATTVVGTTASPAASWAVTVRWAAAAAAPPPSTTTWEVQSWTGTLTVRGGVATTTCAAADVVGGGGAGRVACIDGTARAAIRIGASAGVLGLRLRGTGPLPVDVAFLGLRLTLVPVAP